MPSDAIWDVSMWDSGQWDSATNVLFTGIISGDISLDGSDQVSIPVAPMTEAFRLFAAPRLTGYGPSLTASTFLEVVRDQVDANGVYIFRPFFGDTTTSWVINTTTVNYANLNTSTAADVKDATVWGLIEKLAVSENFVPYVGNDGSFNFVARDYNNTASSFHFIGSGGFSSEYGQTIKKVSWFGKRFSKYYSRVRLKFRGEDTTTSFAIEDSIYEVRGSSGPWTLGEKTLDIQNLWIPTLTVAETIAQELFDEYSAIRTEVEFTTSLVPQLDLLDRVQITYDPTNNSQNSLWDAYDWGDDLAINGATEMLWDSSGGDALKMVAREFRLISIDVNLDSGECKFIGRE